MTRTTQFLRNMDVKHETQNKVDTKATDNWFNRNSNNEYVKVQYSEKRKNELGRITSTWSDTNNPYKDSSGGVNIVDTLENRGIGWTDAIRISDQGLLRIVNYNKDEYEKIDNINDFYEILDNPDEKNPEIFWNNPHVLDLFSSERPGINTIDVANKAKWIINNQNLADDNIIKSNFDKITELFKNNREDIISSKDDIGLQLKNIDKNLSELLSEENIEAKTVQQSFTDKTLESVFGSGSWLANSHVINGYNQAKNVQKYIEKQFITDISEGQLSKDDVVENQPVMINRDSDDNIVITKVKNTFKNADIDDYALAVVKQNLADSKSGSVIGMLNQIGFRTAEVLYNTYESKGRVTWSDLSQLTNTRNLCSSLDVTCPPAEASVGEIRDLVFEGNTKIIEEKDAIVREILDDTIETLKQTSITKPSSNTNLQELANELIQSYDIIHQTSKAKVVRNELYTTLGTDRAMDRGYVQSDEHLFINFLSWRTYQKEADITSIQLNDHYKSIYSDNKKLLNDIRDSQLV